VLPKELTPKSCSGGGLEKKVARGGPGVKGTAEPHVKPCRRSGLARLVSWTWNEVEGIEKKRKTLEAGAGDATGAGAKGYRQRDSV